MTKKSYTGSCEKLQGRGEAAKNKLQYHYCQFYNFSKDNKGVTQGWENIVSKFQVPSSSGLGVKMF